MGRLDAARPQVIPDNPMSRLLSVFLLAAASAFAHVGSPDVFYEGLAGPYHLLVTIRAPSVIPGVAEIEVRSAANDVDVVHIVPTPLTGPGAKFAPVPDLAQRSKDDPQFFTGSLWMMTSGSWQVRVTAEGAKGKGQLSVPVPALSSSTKGMDAPIGIVLAALGLLLLAGAVSIVGAGVREGQLEPGLTPDPARVRRSRWVMALTAVFVLALAGLGGLWWKSEAGEYDKHIFKPLQMSATLDSRENGERLMLRLTDPGWARWRKVDDLVPDHNHLMHLYVIGLPEMDRVWHLHPDRVEAGLFAKDLPPKILVDQKVELSALQVDLYKRVLASADYRRVFEEIDAKGVQRAKVLILKVFTTLRAICNHPALAKEEYQGTAVNYDDSGKLECLKELMEEIADGEHRALLFCQSTKMLDIIEGFFRQWRYNFLRLDGDTPPPLRPELVR